MLKGDRVGMGYAVRIDVELVLPHRQLHIRIRRAGSSRAQVFFVSEWEAETI
jgi:hypothetical protein